ncbi:NRDE-2, necessary for RNA interference-domain-containing protein [Lipomyces oligophaga]|uniref:NRDE-2, necessary for RNA interference-domain-containing protein n=1 Tax=Lipomyces oligophaga TaxID=45792 RepID=UPI0034CDD319
MSDQTEESTSSRAVPKFSFNAGSLDTRRGSRSHRANENRASDIHRHHYKHQYRHKYGSVRTDKLEKNNELDSNDRGDRHTESSSLRHHTTKQRTTIHSQPEGISSNPPPSKFNPRKQEWLHFVSKRNTIMPGRLLPDISAQTPSDELYLQDTTFHPDLVNLGRTYRSPKFFRFGNGKVLGLDPYLRISCGDKGGLHDSSRFGIDVVEKDHGDFEPNSEYSWVLSKDVRKFKYSQSDVLITSLDFIPLSRQAMQNHSKLPVHSILAAEDFRSGDSDSEESNDSDIQPFSANRITDLTRLAESFPTDSRGWHSLANAMIATLPPEASQIRRAEIGLSVYKRAISMAPDAAPLHIEYLSFYEQVHGKYQASKKWSDTLSAFPDLNEIQMAWIDFLIRDSTNFDFDKIREHIIAIFKRIARQIASNSEFSLVIILGRFCEIAIQAGYPELSISIIQFIIYYNFQTPAGSLEACFERGTYRIGALRENQISQTNLNIIDGSWIDQEVLASHRLMPTIFNEINVDDPTSDPFRVVIFSDIEPFIYRFEAPQSLANLVYTCLKVLGYQVSLSIPYPDRWPVEFSLPEKLSVNKIDFKADLLDTNFACNFVETLIDFIADESRLDDCIAESLLETCLTCLYSTADPKYVAEICKRVLDKKRTSLRLWCIYSELIWHQDMKRAEEVLSKAVQYFHDSKNRVLLWRKWAGLLSLDRLSEETELSQNIFAKILDPDHQTQKGILVSEFVSLKDNQNVELAEAALECLSLWYYTDPSSGYRNIDQSLEILRDGIEELLAKNGTIKDRFDLFCSRLLVFDSQFSRLRKVAVLRTQLESCIAANPYSTQYLIWYINNELPFRMEYHTRGIFENLVFSGSATPVKVWCIAISYERQYGNMHSARSMYVRALASISGRRCIGLWLDYVKYLYDNGMKTDAKAILIRGIMECPWSKELIMAALYTYKDSMATLELRNFADLLMQRGLRIRTEIPPNEYNLTELGQQDPHISDESE